MNMDISILFSKLSLPTQEIKNTLIELIYDNKSYSVLYPQVKPIYLTLIQKTDKQIISINIKSKHSGKKSKLIAHGELIIFKQLLIEKPMEKNIILFLNDKDNSKVKPNKENISKIFVKVKYDDSSSRKSTFKEIKNKSLEEPIKTEIKNNNSLDDNNISELIVPPTERTEFNTYNIDDIISIERMNKLKEMVDNDEFKKNLSSKDVNSLKVINDNLLKQYQELNETYYNVLVNMRKNNVETKQKADKYYNKNLEVEKELLKLKLEEKKERELLNQKIDENNEKCNNISKSIKNIVEQEKEILNRVNNDEKEQEQEQDNNMNSFGDANDLKNLCYLVNKLKSLGYYIDENDDMNDNEKQNLEELLKNVDNIAEYKNPKDESINEINKGDFELGNTIVSLIERDVNNLYDRKLIEQIKIDQIDAITYVFSGETKKKQVSFKMENNHLICSTGETFSVWLIKYFST